MAHKKGVGSTDNGRDSKSKRLGVKLFGGQEAKAGNIIVRQRGTKFHPGDNVYMGKDYTLHAAIDGTIHFRRKKNNRTYVSVFSDDMVVTETATKPTSTVKEEPKSVAEPTVEVKNMAEDALASAPAIEESPALSDERVEETPSQVVEEKEVAEEEIPAEEPKAEEVKDETPAEQPKAKVEKLALPSGKKIEIDDLKVVEGIGPKIEGLLNDAGIHTWSDLANADLDKLQAILDEAGSRYRMHDPGTWAKQAQLCVEEKWAELETYQEQLKGGKE